VYAAAHLIFNDDALFDEGLPDAERRSARNAVAELFLPVFEPRVAGEGEAVTSLSEAASRARRRLESFRASSVQDIEDPLASAVLLEERVEERIEAALPVSRTRRAFAPAEPARPGLIELSVPPSESAANTDRVYRVWYGTNRAAEKPTDEALGYGGEQDVRLHLGYCHVFVPRHHQTGSLGTSWLRRLITFQPDDRVELRARFPLAPEEFQRKLEAELALWDGARTALVYVHGFRVTFDEAACLAAQIGCDLEVNGIISFFSWPAAGKLDRYVRDRETADLGEFAGHFVQFLDKLLSVAKLDRVNIVAHSMGNRLLAASIAAVQKLAAARSVSIGHLVLAAPDISRVEFKNVAPLYKATAHERVTLYSCRRDRALFASSKVNGYLRIGFEPPVFCHDAVDTISVSKIRVDLLGHGYIATAKPVIEDLKRLLWLNQPPAMRNLEPVPTQGIADYWRLRKTS
jgi:esterase/lipase superfamily enzyme